MADSANNGGEDVKKPAAAHGTAAASTAGGTAAGEAPPREASPAAAAAPAATDSTATAPSEQDTTTTAAVASETAAPVAAAGDSAEEERSRSGSSSRDEDADDDETETTEESPCGRWLKRREEIKYRDVPGIDTSFLAMDSEEGVEVVWNEALFSSSKKFKAQEEKLKRVFEALTQIEHPNIVHFHHYWLDPGTVATATTTTATKEGTSAATAPKEGNPVGSGSAEATNKKLPRLIFITEYMSSGSLKQFLRKTKRNNRSIQLKSWKRWVTQILYALSYLHQRSEPAIIHGNLTCDTIFIQHNGLVKIGSIAPDVIHQTARATDRDTGKNLHYLAPEWSDREQTPGTASDIYSFGIAALETAALDIQSVAPAAAVAAASITAAAVAAVESSAAGSSSAPSSSDKKSEAPAAEPTPTPSSDPKESSSSSSAASSSTTLQLPQQTQQQQQPRPASSLSSASSGTESPPTTAGIISEEQIRAAIDQLENEQQRDFIRKCLNKDPAKRPTAVELLFHPALYEVHSLKLLAAHVQLNSSGNIQDSGPTDEAIQSHYGKGSVMATVVRGGETKEYKLKDLAPAEKLEKFVEDVRFGIYPITNFGLFNSDSKNRAMTPEGASAASASAAPQKKTSVGEKEVEEKRRISQCLASVGPSETRPGTMDFIFVIRFNEGKNRLLTTPFEVLDDDPGIIADSLIETRFCNVLDRDLIAGAFADVFRKMICQQVEVLMASMESGKTIQQLRDEYDDREKLDERLKTMPAKELLLRDKAYFEMKWYDVRDGESQSEADARNPEVAVKMRDPMNVTKKYPMPEGAHFCGPVAVEGSEPFRDMAPGTNAFDYTQIEEQLKTLRKVEQKQQQKQQQPQQLQQQQQQLPPVSSAEATEKGATMPFTPQQEATYDPNVYLQGAQKVLENLTQQQVSQLAPASQQSQTFTPSVTPGGPPTQQPQPAQPAESAPAEGDQADPHQVEQPPQHQPAEEGRDTTS